MKIDEPLLNKISKLARLNLSNQEKKIFTHQLSDVLGYVEKINKLQTQEILPAEHIASLKNIIRDDRVLPSLEPQSVQKIAPNFQEDKFIVPKIIEDSA